MGPNWDIKPLIHPDIALFAQGITMPLTIIAILVVGLNALIHYVLLVVLRLGLDGAALAMTLSNWLLAILLLAYILWWRIYPTTWPGWTRASLLHWYGALRQVIVSDLGSAIGMCVVEDGAARQCAP